MKNLEDRLASLSPEQRAVFEALRQAAKKKPALAAGPPEPILVREPGVPVPLSFDQERLWFLDLVDPGSPAYNIATVTRMEGPLRIPALLGALDEIVRRHEAWRTTFRDVDGEPVQVIHASGAVPVPVVDLRALPDAARGELSIVLCRSAASRPFDLVEGPLLRSLLVQVRDRETLCLLTVHHIVSDLVSFQLFWRELGALYVAFAAGRPSPLPELPVQFADFVLWQRRRLAGPALERLLAFWTAEIEGAPHVLELPLDRPRPAAQTTRGGLAPVRLSPGSSAALRAFGRKEGATPFIAVLALWNALLARYTGLPKLLVGSPNANRNRGEIEGLFGFFLTQLVFATDVAGDPSFRELLRRTRGTALRAYGHQELSFGKLVEAVRPERNPARAPLVQVNIQLFDAEHTAFDLPDLKITSLDLDQGVSQFDVTLALYDGAEEIAGGLEYNLDLFEAATMARMAEALLLLVEGAMADPDRPLSALPLLPEAARHQALREWNDTALTAAEALPGLTLADLFERQAAATPEATALVAGDASLTYAELSRRTERLAGRLRRLGVGPEVRVGLYLPRSLELVVATLAVTRAGGAFVTLDPAYPRERLSFMLADAGARVLIVPDGQALPGLPEVAPEVARLSPGAALETEGADAPGAPGGRRATPGNLAYLIYTSGSTGRPKGVAIEHRSAMALLAWGRRTFSAAELAGMVGQSAVSFDMWMFELFAPLTSGGRLILAASLLELPALPAAAAATMVTAVPAVMAELLRDGALPPSVATVILGGEVLPRALAGRVHGQPGVRRLVNAYGPTEDTTYSTTAEVPAGGTAAPAIGRPLPGGRAHLLDAGLRPVPLGVPAELFLAGAGLARGYLDRPDLTAERFVPDPLAAEPGERAYRTGDLARYRPSGEIEYLGRLDSQVKLRGFRIEPAEIEQALQGHPEVWECAVVLAGGTRLVAFVVAREGADPAASRLLGFLKDRLPAPMLPAAFLTVAELPLSPNGKVDRRALARRAANAADAAGAAGHAAPRNAAEELLAAIWCELLDVPRVSVADDFFALGGHSLLATQLVARVRRAFGVELPQRTVFEDATLAALAASVTALLARGEGAAGEEPPPPGAFAGGAAPAGWPAGDAALPPLSFSQERLWLIDQVEPASSAYNMPLALRLSGPLAAAALAAAWSALAARHASLRTRFAVREGEPWQRTLPPAPVPVPHLDLTALAPAPREREAERLAVLLGRLPFDLARDPVLRVALVALGPREHALLVTVHHIASDGWSNGVLVREMVALYEAFAAGRPSPLAPLPLTYADYARWQRATVAGPRLAAMMEFFRRELADLPPLELPTDRPRGGPATGGAVEALAVGPAAAGALRALGRRTGTTLFMALLAGFQAVLGRWSGQRDFAVGTPVAGRRFVELEGLIGFFVNTLVLRADLSGSAQGPTGAVLLERVRGRALAAFAHQDLPFEKLVSELNPERSLAHTPLFQVMCILQNTPAPPVELADLTVASRAPAMVTAKFDLTLSWAEAEGGLEAFLEYRPELFDRTTAKRLLAWTEAALAGLAAAPERALAELPLLSPAERQAVLAEWNDGATAGEPPSLDEILFGPGAAALDPAAVALVGEEGSLCRGELWRRTGALARQLRGLGVGPGSRVAICLPRSAQMVVAVLGTLAAGAAYVPLDPAYPAASLAFMLADSGAVVLLSTAELAARLPGFGGVVVEVGDSERYGIVALTPGPSPAAGEGNLLRPFGERPDPLPDDLAYVCYTSGSTGRPKGVAMTRRALGALLAWQAGALPGPARTLQFAPLSFDVAFQEIGSAWAGGGALVLVDDETRRDGAALLGHLERHGVERLFLPFVALAYLAEAAAASPRQLALRDIVTAGEQLQVTGSVAAFVAGLPGCRLHNHYGPTETHVATALTLAGDPAGWPRLPAIGRPIAGARALLLDEAGEAVPLGASGELGLGGACLARGYFARPDLTAARFVPDPWGPPGARLYKTGDRARHLADGRLEYQGRTDDQVKIRGIRVEPGEVEAVLADLPEIARAAVVARQGSGGRFLAAFYVAAPGADPSPERLAAHLAARLPPALVPSRFVALPELPLTPSGKVSRRVLAGLPLDGDAGAGFAPPQGETEEILAGAWSELLGGVRVSRADDFFALGGHSLLATQLVARVRRIFAVELPQRAVFEAPALAALAARIDRLRAEGEDLEEPPPPRAFAGGAAPAGWPGGDAGEPPLSFSQERLWLIAQRDPGSNAYNVPLALRLSGPLAAAPLAAAWSELATRHASLRTRVAVRGGRPWQRILPPAPVPLPLLDLTGLPPARREREVERLLDLTGRLPFDLDRDPVLRVALIALGEPAAERLPPAARSGGTQVDLGPDAPRLCSAVHRETSRGGRGDGPAEHVLLATLHHIAWDGWSNGILVREMGALYDAFAAGRPSPLPPLPMAYADYARWQRATVAGPRLDGLMEHFRRELAGLPAPALPTDRPRGSPAAGGAAETLALDPAAVEPLYALCRRTGTTLFMALLAACQAVLGRASGQRDFAVGAPVAGRRFVELEGMIGFFVNTLVLRADLSGGPEGPTGGELLERVRARTLAAFAHQDLPFEKLAAELSAERSLTDQPFFQAMCGLQNAPDPPVEFTGLAACPLGPVDVRAKFNLNLSWTEVRGGLAAVLDYQPELFDRATVKRLLSWTAAVLAGLAAAPERALAELPLLSPAERQAMLVEWNDTALEEPAGLTLADLFARQAAATPGATALVAGEVRLTYAELAARAERLAGRLQALGVGPEVRVGLCLPRSLDLVVATLAVALAGGAFVTLDPAYPPERLSYMLADAKAAVLLAPAGGGPALSGVGPEVAPLSPDAGEVPAGAWNPARRRAGSGNLAYLIYTSGSTGRPKGVAIEQRSAAALLAWGRRAFSPAELAGVLGQSSVSFDMWIFELFVPLTTGGRLILAEGGLLDLPRLPAAAQVTMVTAVPAVMAELLRDGALPPSVATVLLGGEVLPRALADRVHAQPGVRRLINGYGPTEDTTYSTTAEVPGGDAAAAAAPAIGRPLAGGRAHLLDAELRPAPLGAPAELFLAGAGLARGYFGRPDLTAERFIPDPLASEPGGRAYRTSDLARHRPGGELEYLGRIDGQVKLRGFRIELAEIEEVLQGHPKVWECAAVVVEGGAGSRLVAFVVARQGESPSAPELLGFLEHRLPAPMLPAAFLPLAELPLSPNGKVDRRALAELAGEAGGAGGHVAPRNATEERLAAIWRELLGLERVSVTGDFFALGGHSLLAIQLASRIERDFGIEVPTAFLFQLRALEEQAREILKRRQAGAGGKVDSLLEELDDLAEEEVLALLAAEERPGADR